MTFSYDGSGFYGYQKQKGYRTIQDEIEKALLFINNNHYVELVSSGRTDKGVHALCQKAHFDINVDITLEKLKRALNSNLPNDIHVIEVLKVDNNFHARYMVKKKEYKYYINMGEYNPILRNYELQYGRYLDIESMSKAIIYFIGPHNFKAFTPSKDKRNNYNREIYDAKIEASNNKVVISFLGNGFLKYQIRNMVGYLIKVGEHQKDGNDIPKILLSEDRRSASITAHSEGLYLTKIEY